MFDKGHYHIYEGSCRLDHAPDFRSGFCFNCVRHIMPRGEVGWIISRGISLRDAAEWVGFKVDNLADFSAATQKEFKAAVINSIVTDLDTEWEEQRSGLANFSFSDSLAKVKSGIYVLCLDGGLCVNYPGGNSRVLYIGKGKIRQRIKNHLEEKLLDFFLQIPGIKFRFYMAEPKKPGPGGAEYFHDFEHDLLAEFSRLYSSEGQDKLWPMFNKNAGRAHTNDHKHKSKWNLPLKNTNTRYVWSLSPTTEKASPKFQD